MQRRQVRHVAKTITILDVRVEAHRDKTGIVERLVEQGASLSKTGCSRAQP